MYLQDGTRDHFLTFIGREFPAMLPRLEKLYARKYPPDAYRQEVKAMVSVLQRRHGLDASKRSSPDQPIKGSTVASETAATQVGFAW
jgi:hypothetical protein